MTYGSAPYAPRTVLSVRHAIAIIREVEAAPAAPTVSALSRRVGLAKSATHRLLASLVAEHLIDKDARGRYRPGWGLYELGASVAEASDIRRVAGIPLRGLAAETGGAALFAVFDRDTVLYVDREQSGPVFPTSADAGRRSPLHATASGKVLLNAMPVDQARACLRRPLAALTTATVTDPRRLWCELEKARIDGYAVCWGEREPALASVAVPALTPDGAVLGAIAVVLPTEQMRRRAPSRVARGMRETAMQMTERMRAVAGYRAPGPHTSERRRYRTPIDLNGGIVRKTPAHGEHEFRAPTVST